MSDDQTQSVLEKEVIRPVLVMDRRTVKEYLTCLRRMLVGLADESVSVAVICPPEVGQAVTVCPSMDLIGYPIFRIPLFWKQNRRVLLESVEKFKPTILHCMSTGRWRITDFLSRELDIPYVMSFPSVGRRMFRPMVSTERCGSLIGSSAQITDYLSQTYSKFDGQIRQINMGTFVEDNCACFANARRIASLVIAQRLDSTLDYEALLGAVRHLAIEGYEFILAIIGKGPAERDIHSSIRNLKLSQIVTVVPGINPIRSVFAGADIFIHCQPGKSCDSHLMEAMGVGMAVATCKDNVDDLAIEDKTAIFFEPNDELSIYNALRRLLSKREFAREIALNGQEHIRKHNSVSKMVAAHLQTYSQVQSWYKQHKVEQPVAQAL